MHVDRNGLEVLTREECLHLIDTVLVGRIAITARAMPAILPVNFRRVGEQIVFRTGRGAKLEAATDNAVIAFEVDQVDPVAHTGWSVLVTGVARELTSESQLGGITFSELPRWAPGSDSRVVAIDAEMVSGRRIIPGRVRPGVLTEL